MTSSSSSGNYAKFAGPHERPANSGAAAPEGQARKPLRTRTLLALSPIAPPEESASVVAAPNGFSARMRRARESLRAASDEREIRARLLEAGLVIGSRAALFELDDERLIGLPGPGPLAQRVAGKTLPESPTVRAAMRGTQRIEQLEDIKILRELGEASALPCIFLPVFASGRPVLMLYIDREGEGCEEDERALAAELCTLAEHRFSGLQTGMHKLPEVVVDNDIARPRLQQNEPPRWNPPSHTDYYSAMVQTRRGGIEGIVQIGRYELVDLVRQGGTGAVYTCRFKRESGFSPLYALKLLRQSTAEDPEGAELFLRSAEFLSRSNHPNLVRILDYGTHEDAPYQVMDFIDGCDFSQVLAANPSKRPPALIASVMSEALAGLHAAHTLRDEHGDPLHLVHSDISPQNLLIGLDGVSRISDFGLARIGRGLERGASVRGKPGYLSPEQVRGLPLDCRSDVFSMGVMLYNALTGVELFAAGSVEATLEGVLTHTPPPPSRVGLQPPACFDALCLKALARDPEERFASAHEMLIELQTVAANLPRVLPGAVAKWVEVSRERVPKHGRAERATWPEDETMVGYPAADAPPPARPGTTTNETNELGESEFSQTMRLPIVPRRHRLANAVAIVFLAALAFALFQGLADPEKVQAMLESVKSSVSSEAP